MRITCIRGSELTPADMWHWAALQACNSSLASPYFCPEFTALVSAVRDDVRVGILSERGQAVGFFPFQGLSRGKAEPLAKLAGDFHGVVAAAGTDWNPQALLHGCALEEWQFDQLLADQAPFRPYHEEIFPALFINLKCGYDAYVQQRQATGTRQLRQVDASRHKLERERGTVRFVPRTCDAHVFAQLKNWKRAQYCRLGTFDRFEVPWLAELLERLCGECNHDFAGMLSALYCGDVLVAAHLGMRSRCVWHYWFPAYDPAFAEYQPGLITLVEMIRYAETLGINRIDLGAGGELYKRRLANASVLLASGCVSVNDRAPRS